MRSSPKNAGERTLFPRWLLAILAVYGVLALLCVCWGRFTGDEGFFALAARNVLEGKRPYRDFMFLQMPLLAYVCAGWFHLFGSSILSGRALSALFGAGSVTLIALAAFRRTGLAGGILAGILCACNLNFVFDTASFKTQSLTLFLTSSALLVLARKDPPNRLLQSALAALWLSLAFLERLSILPALVLLWLYLAWHLRASPRQFLCLLAANLMLLGATVAFFWADGNMLFDVYWFHQEYFGFPPWTVSKLALTVVGWIANQLPIVFCFVVATWALVRQRSSPLPALREHQPLCWFLLLSYWAMTAIHWMNVQSYPIHQTSITAFAAVFSGIVLASFVSLLIKETGSLAVFGGVALLILSMPFQEWVVHFDGRGSIKKIEETVATIRKFSHPGDSLLSFNAELAVDGGFRAAEGYELSEFSYLPNLAEERRAKLKATNFRKLSSDISSRQHQILCLGERELDLMSAHDAKTAKELRALIDQNYRCVGETAQYGQFFEPLYILVLKTNEAPRNL